MSKHWYALHVKPNKERYVTEHLTARDFDVYFPRLKVKPVNPRSRRERPFFSGYLFVQLNLDEVGRDALRWVEGAHGLVTLGDEPARVPEEFVTIMRRRLKKIEAAGGLVFESLRPGDRVYIKEGSFAGYEAVFDRRLSDSDRVQVLLAYIQSRPVRVRLPAAHVEKRRRRRS